uniref:Uncharacterized protein AlNc14C251G9643 n=1 Tax=Albugo laibachii Nc14 TaxID=890382 RepID=F0WTG4_9STRA|nr:conserved hypothetical protein [Albugo laibachii Nc14]|eukprot:CCA24654.1 conserved hypothetical protein [Albugo laibachii Nc14]
MKINGHRPLVYIGACGAHFEKLSQLGTRKSSMANLISAILAVALSKYGTSTTTGSYPGRCSTFSDCKAAYGNGYDCVAVETKTPGLEQLTMCISTGAICSGRLAGTCPTFSSWPSAYRVVQPVCAFTPVQNCTSFQNVSASSTTSGNNSSTSSNTTVQTDVDCYSRTFSSNETNVTVNGIYKCMDATNYVSSNGGHIANMTSTQIANCGGALNDPKPILCNAHGTCAPTKDFSQEYSCRCNAGYNSSNYCATIVSNDCDNLGQCGAKGKCIITNGQSNGTCSCSPGAKGDQCSKCDPSSSAACNGQGACGSDGSCTCTNGYSGPHCDVSPTTDSGTKKTTEKSDSTSIRASYAGGIVIAVFALIVV